jgi:protein tyrosine phosphatase (PTP) superfamily phosphohydrolase (DUF442 family)
MNTGAWILRPARIPVVIAFAIAVLAAIPAAAAPAEDSLLVRLADVKNIARPYPWLLTGGQPDSSALGVLAAAGVVDVFDLRLPTEARGFDEASVAWAAGLRYLPIPTAAADFDDARFTAIRHHLIAHGPERPMFIHCATGRRVGAALLPWLILDEGMSPDLAIEMARQMGLGDPQLTAVALAYVRAHEPPKPKR